MSFNVSVLNFNIERSKTASSSEAESCEERFPTGAVISFTFFTSVLYLVL